MVILVLWACASASGQTNNIKVCYQKTTMLVFPQNIKDADFGSADIIVRQPKRTANVLKVKAARKAFEPTNISVITTGGKLYSINVYYDEDPPVQAYDTFTQSGTVPTVAFDEAMSPAEIEYYAQQVSISPPRLRRPVFSDNRMKVQLRNIYIKDGLLFFAFSISNHSQIPYDVYFTRFYVRDMARAKRTTALEKEIAPRHVYFSTDSTIIEGEPVTVVAAFDKFTIAEKKHFDIEVYEEGGDRLLKIRIKGRHILAATPFVKPLPVVR
ncbi:conjugative transposon protein TraN [Chitinophaga sp. YIM B06452]|uniref:conjugative transposon protein TraN n=1 Tax=Chitinophaga sp. YIM B06452 TaxID=3082158 RepID=UPI0031FE51D3